jgi:DNA-binding NarL/FixJ family response regulator
MAAENMPGFVELLEQLRLANRLLVIQLMRAPSSKFTQADLIGKLASTGIPVKEIARALDTTSGTVQVAISRHKKKRGGEVT